MKLRVLDERINTRVQSMQREHPWWPCAAGCDHCCRSLPHLPDVSDAEAERMIAAIRALPQNLQDAISARAAERQTAPVTCPLLDRERGMCLICDARPIACRTYGFYAERDAGLHCDKVSEAVSRHDEPIVWGNGEAIASDLRELGEPSLRWLARLFDETDERHPRDTKIEGC